MPDPAPLVRLEPADRPAAPLPERLRGAVLAIGNFDGFHRGHRAVLDAAIAHTARDGTPPALLTFTPHPRRFFRPDVPLFRLTDHDVLAELAQAAGAAATFILPFDAALAELSAQEFLDRIVCERLGAAGVAVGEGFRFGKGQGGTTETLAEWGRATGRLVVIVPPAIEAGERISSSAIRATLAEGDIARANLLLGHRWRVRGEVRHGDKRGRELNYPTANLHADSDCGLRFGIYAVRARLMPGGGWWNGVASFGSRPTFDNGVAKLEVHLFDMAPDLYGQVLDVEFHAFLRPEARFETIDALIVQMDADSAAARAVLAGVG